MAHRLLVIAAAGLAALLLRVAAPTPAAAVAELGSIASAADVSAPLVAAAALLAWALLTHLALVVALTLASGLPGRSGAAGDAVLRCCAPAGLRRVVALALGVGLAVGTGAGAASAQPGAAATPPTVSFDWPTPTDVRADARVPSLDWPAQVAAAEPAPAEPTPAEPTPAGEVVVAPGDTLWSLARADLPPEAVEQEVAQAWPSWWAANRAVIGDDPDLIHPGQSLRVPR